MRAGMCTCLSVGFCECARTRAKARVLAVARMHVAENALVFADECACLSRSVAMQVHARTHSSPRTRNRLHARVGVWVELVLSGTCAYTPARVRMCMGAPICACALVYVCGRTDNLTFAALGSTWKCGSGTLPGFLFAARPARRCSLEPSSRWCREPDMAAELSPAWMKLLWSRERFHTYTTTC